MTVTPAQELYEHWAKIIEDYYGPGMATNQSLFYGQDKHMGIGFTSQPAKTTEPTINFGYLYHSRNTPNAFFQVTRDGEFRFPYQHGWQGRDVLARATFLTWNKSFSQFNWLYDPTHEEGSYSTSELKRPNRERFYISERTLRLQQWQRERVWLKLEPEPGDNLGWKIAFSRDPNDPSANGTPVTQADFDKFEVLRQKRYERIRRAEQRAAGLLTKSGTVRKTAEEEEQERLQAAAQIGAHFKVSIPARTTSLRKVEEEGLWLPNGCP